MLSFTADLAVRDLYPRHLACGETEMVDSIKLIDPSQDAVLVENLTTSVFDLSRVRPWLEAFRNLCTLFLTNAHAQYTTSQLGNWVTDYTRYST